MASIPDFVEVFLAVRNAGFTVASASYDGRHFGYWHIEIEKKGWPTRCLVWEARDRGLILRQRDDVGDWADQQVFLEAEHSDISAIIDQLREQP